ncbi:hypothetical protein A1353_08885 [Methylomonas methanica]|uniref:Uncharacterized protein n=1 Tax=Methylomonas methanica TaxID=421 RepID=A0A177MNP8_METMH|nr:hypothetical protein [Methylomonas methanica]OAI06540.1 hypothetical protein A1353_08885 [Methylomonas methanica]
MDSYLNIVSLALAIAALVPVLVPATRVRFWTLTAAALSLIVLLGFYQSYQEYSARKSVIAVHDEIWHFLTKYRSGLTYEQIYDNLYYRSLPIANLAINSMVDSGRVLTEKIEVTDTEGNKYLVRRYYRNFGDYFSRIGAYYVSLSRSLI